MGRLAGGLARLGCAVAATVVCAPWVGCSEPGMVPDAWVPPAWVDPWAALDHGTLRVWVVVPHGNPYALNNARIAKRSITGVREQTEGSFGVSSTELPAAMRAANHPNADDVAAEELQHDPQFDLLEQHLRRDFPDLDVDFEDVSEDAFANGPQHGLPVQAPDAILGNPLPNAVRSKGFLVNCSEYEVPQVDQAASGPRLVPQMVLLGGFERSKAFALWLSEGSGSRFEEQTELGDSAAKVAVRAFQNLLAGRNVGADADPEMLPVLSKPLPAPPIRTPMQRDPVTGRMVPIKAARKPDDVQVEAISTQAGWESAEVMLRATRLANAQLDIWHAMMILRMDDSGHWRVLHIARDLSVPQQRAAMRMFATAGTAEERVFLNEGMIPQGISQAAPIDGDQRPPQPYLWWDNLGGATLQVVEWQPGLSASNLFFIPDSANRLKTEVTARFASNPGQYGWRVWSVGPDGTVLVGTWRTLKIAPQ